MVPMPPHNRKCQCEPGMGSSCLIPRPFAYVVIIFKNIPLPTETDNTEWEHFTTLPEQDDK